MGREDGEGGLGQKRRARWEWTRAWASSGLRQQPPHRTRNNLTLQARSGRWCERDLGSPIVEPVSTCTPVSPRCGSLTSGVEAVRARRRGIAQQVTRPHQRPGQQAVPSHAGGRPREACGQQQSGRHPHRPSCRSPRLAASTKMIYSLLVVSHNPPVPVFLNGIKGPVTPATVQAPAAGRKPRNARRVAYTLDDRRKWQAMLQVLMVEFASDVWVLL